MLMEICSIFAVFQCSFYQRLFYLFFLYFQELISIRIVISAGSDSYASFKMAENYLSLFIVKRGSRVLGIHTRKLFLVCFLKEAMSVQWFVHPSINLALITMNIRLISGRFGKFATFLQIALKPCGQVEKACYFLHAAGKGGTQALFFWVRAD